MNPEEIKRKSQKSKELQQEIEFSYGNLIYMGMKMELEIKNNTFYLNKLKESLDSFKDKSLPDDVSESIIKEINNQINSLESNIKCAKQCLNGIKKNIAKYEEI